MADGFKMFGKTRESIYDAKIEILRPENGVNIDLVGYKIIWMRWQLSCKKIVHILNAMK